MSNVEDAHGGLVARVREWLHRLSGSVTLGRRDADLDAEIRLHLALAVEDEARRGVSAADALRSATIASGSRTQALEALRDQRGLPWLRDLLHDSLYALRQTRRQPALWSTILVTLIIGIAASTTIFTVVNGVLLQPLPYPDDERLVSLSGLSYKGEYLELGRQSRTLHIGAFLPPRPVSLTGHGEAARLEAASASAELFSVLGVDAVHGRTFTAADTARGAPPAVILGHALWQQRFGGDPAVVGALLTIGGVGHTVIGVMPAAFRFPAGVQLWLPLVIDPADRIALWSTSARMVGRLRTGIGHDQADAELRRLVPAFRASFPWKMSPEYGTRTAATPLREAVVGDVGPILIVFLAAVATLLLMLCVNIASLLLTRGLSRQRELAIRAAVGATRLRLVRQLIVESVTMALIAGVAGTALAFALVGLMIRLLPADVPRLDEIAIDGSALAFALAATTFSGVLFGALPALQAASAVCSSPLRGTASVARRAAATPISGLLATAEFALAAMLVVTAALLATSFWNLISVDPGFRAPQLLTATVAPPERRYPNAEARRRFTGGLLQRIAATAGVDSVAAGNVIPFAGSLSGTVLRLEGRPDPATLTGAWPSADVRAVITPTYLQVLNAPILEGRAFTEADTSAAPPVALVSRALAGKYWGSASPVGTRVRFAGAHAPWITIVGVVGDLKWSTLGQEDSPFSRDTAAWLGTIYLPLAQSDAAVIRVVVRTRVPDRLAADFRGIVQSLDRDAPVADMATGERLIARSAARPRFTALLLGAFASIAVLFGAIGVYGVLAHAVSRRTQEFAIRLAVGGSSRAILRGVVGDGMRLAVTGIVIGLAGATLTSRGLSRLLFGVGPADPRIFAAVALALALIGFLASYIPARRALHVNPMMALKAD